MCFRYKKRKRGREGKKEGGLMDGMLEPQAALRGPWVLDPTARTSVVMA